MEKKSEISSTELKRQWAKDGLMIWMELSVLNKTQNELLKEDKEDKRTWTTVWEDSDPDTFNVKHKNT